MCHLKVFTYSISYCKDNIKCDSVSNGNKCPLNNGVFIVQKLVVKLSNTSTMLFPPVAKTLSKCLRVWQQVFEQFMHCKNRVLVSTGYFSGICRIITFLLQAIGYFLLVMNKSDVLLTCVKQQPGNQYKNIRLYNCKI